VEDYATVEFIFDSSDIMERLSMHRVLDNLHRNPIHVPAAAGSTKRLDWFLECMSEEDRNHALSASGLDGMTPLHLATRSGASDFVRRIFRSVEPRILLNIADHWGREAIHPAASFGYDNIGKQLLQEGCQLGSIDETGRTPVRYLLKGDVSLTGSDDNSREDKSGTDSDSPSDSSEADSLLTLEGEFLAEPDTSESHDKDEIASRRNGDLEKAVRGMTDSPLVRLGNNASMKSHAADRWHPRPQFSGEISLEDTGAVRSVADICQYLRSRFRRVTNADDIV